MIGDIGETAPTIGNLGINVRSAGLRDLEGMRAILGQWVQNSQTHEVIHEEVDAIMESVQLGVDGVSNAQYFVAEREGRVVGMVGLESLSPRMQEYFNEAQKQEEFGPAARPIEIPHIYVDRKHHRKGIGRELVATVVAKAQEQGYNVILLNSGPRYRFTGWPFHKRVLGDVQAVLPDCYGEGAHAPVWRMDLSPEAAGSWPRAREEF